MKYLYFVTEGDFPAEWQMAIENFRLTIYIFLVQIMETAA